MLNDATLVISETGCNQAHLGGMGRKHDTIPRPQYFFLEIKRNEREKIRRHVNSKMNLNQIIEDRGLSNIHIQFG